MTVQEWLEELERLRKAATPGPWNQVCLENELLPYIIRIRENIDGENMLVASLAGTDTSNPNADAAYIVAACNAVPRLLEMVKFLSEEASGDAGYLSDDIIWTPEEKLQEAYESTEPKE